MSNKPDPRVEDMARWAEEVAGKGGGDAYRSGVAEGTQQSNQSNTKK